MITCLVCILSNIVKHHSHVWSQVCLCPRNNEVGVRCGRKVHALVTANTGAMIREIKHIETKTTASQRKFISFPIAIEDNQDYNGGFGIWDRFDHIFCPSLAIVGSYVMISSEKRLWAIKNANFLCYGSCFDMKSTEDWIPSRGAGAGIRPFPFVIIYCNLKPR